MTMIRNDGDSHVCKWTAINVSLNGVLDVFYMIGTGDQAERHTLRLEEEDAYSFFVFVAAVDFAVEEGWLDEKEACDAVNAVVECECGVKFDIAPCHLTE